MRDIFRRFFTALRRSVPAAFLLCCMLLTLFPFSSARAQIYSITDVKQRALTVSTTIVISQFQTAGGNNDDEFIELHNVSSEPVNLNGHRLVYRSASGTNDVELLSWTTSTIIPAGGFYLVARTGGSGGYDGSVQPDAAYTGGSLSATAGGIALRSGALNTGTIIDAVGYGSATNIFFEGTRTGAPAAHSSRARGENGCADTDDNSADFELLNPSAPRNSSFPVSVCGGGGSPTSPSGTGSAEPSVVSAGGSVLLKVNVTLGTNPASTGITVTADLSQIGGASNQQFYDDGTNGDEIPGDNVFSFETTVAPETSNGAKSLPVAINDAEGRNASAVISLNVGSVPQSSSVHLTLGNPSNAVADVNQPFNYLLDKPQYAVSYHRDRAIPNWVAWHLDSSWLGSTSRRDDYRPDPTLPEGWYRVSANSYSGSGFDRGHHTPSGDRTASREDNSSVFLMTNMMPQAPGNNQGPWEKLETYSRNLVGQGYELYIYAGGAGTGGTGTEGYATTVDSGRVTVPAKTWKVILILPSGTNDVARVNTQTRTIAVIMPNNENIRQDSWQKYLATVDQVEALTGFDFFSNVDPAIQAVIESRLDAASNTAPVANPQTVTLAEDTPKLITLTGSDANVNNELSFQIVSGPANGTLTPANPGSPNAGTFIYTPNPDFYGTDSFTFKANDSTADSAPATVTLNVTPVNDAPTAVEDSKTTNKNTPLIFPASDLTANDNAGAANESGQTLTVTEVITTAQTRGTVSLVGGQITFQPETDFTGVTGFDYKVCDNGTTNGAPDPKCSIGTVIVNVVGSTVASVAIQGQVLNSNGRGISGAFVFLTDQNGVTLFARTNPFGFYRFESVATGEYVLEASHKSYRFASQPISVTKGIGEVIIVANP